MSGFTSLENGADAEQLQHDNDSKSDGEATTRAELDVFCAKNTHRWNYHVWRPVLQRGIWSYQVLIHFRVITFFI